MFWVEEELFCCSEKTREDKTRGAVMLLCCYAVMLLCCYAVHRKEVCFKKRKKGFRIKTGQQEKKGKEKKRISVFLKLKQNRFSKTK